MRSPSNRVSQCAIESDRQDNLLVSSIYLLKIQFAAVIVYYVVVSYNTFSRAFRVQ